MKLKSKEKNAFYKKKKKMLKTKISKLKIVS